MVFKAPNGRYFDSKEEYRDYMMETYYSFRGIYDQIDPLIKKSGDLNGQPFEIDNCSNSSLILLDTVDQVQIDNLTGCKVFIGACNSTVFIRNCIDCEFFICTKQLRLRDVKQCSLHIFCQTEIHIELSTELKFGPFLGGYPDQKRHFNEVGFDPSINYWYNVYDHNDADKLSHNWSLLSQEEYGQPWFPIGNCNQIASFNAPPSESRVKATSYGQVGESFDLSHMINDDLNKTKAASKSPVIMNKISSNIPRNIEYEIPKPSLREKSYVLEKLYTETALLIGYSIGNDINVNVWLSEDLNEGKVPVQEFNRKLTSLASMVGMNQDKETMRELELAVCKKSLNIISEICAVQNPDDKNNLYINVTYFLQLCQEKLDEYMSEMDTDNGQTGKATISTLGDEEEYDYDETNTNNRSATDFVNFHDDNKDNMFTTNHSKDFDDFYLMSKDDYEQNLKSSANIKQRPQSAPAGKRGYLSGETLQDTFSPPIDDAVSPSQSVKRMSINLPALSPLSGKANDTYMRNSVKLPSSPYDEAVDVLDNGDDDIDTEYLNSRRGNKSFSPAKTVSSVPSAKSPRRYTTESEGLQGLPTRTRRHSFSGRISGLAKEKEKTPAELLNELKDLVEDLVRKTVEKTDLYHILQVHLGFIEDYTMIPPRGQIIQSKKRLWITQKELQTAFMAARLILNQSQIVALMSLVVAFSKDFAALYKNKVSHIKPKEKEIKAPALGPNSSINFDWFKKYLLHLRLSKRKKSSSATKVSALSRSYAAVIVNGSDQPNDQFLQDRKQDLVNNVLVPKTFNEWLGIKYKDGTDRSHLKPEEFKKALSGKPYQIMKEDMNNLLEKHKLLTPEELQEEITCRINSWILDISGRRDFKHVFNTKLRRWLSDNKQKKESKLRKWFSREKLSEEKWKQLSPELIWKRLSDQQQKEVKEEITEEALKEKNEELVSSERVSSAITKELFWKYDAEVKETQKMAQVASKNKKDNKKKSLTDEIFSSKAPQEILWSNWKVGHLLDFKGSIDDFKIRSEETKEKISTSKNHKSKVAGLSYLEAELQKISQSLPQYHQIELRKGILALRKTAEQKGLAKGKIVTREDFETHIKPDIYFNGSFIDRDIFDSLFSMSLTEAVEKLLEVESLKGKNVPEGKEKFTFDVWKETKDKLRDDQLKKQREVEEQRKNIEKAKLLKGEIAHLKWKKLRAKNKYKSLVDKKAHFLPGEDKIVKHSTSRWQKDVF